MNDKFNDTLSSLLDEGRINYVIANLLKKLDGGIQAHPDFGPLRLELERVADTYSAMRRYLIEGNADPGRLELYERLKQQIRSIGRRYLFILNENRLDPFFAEYRMGKIRKTNLPEILQELQKSEFYLAKAEETEADTLPFKQKQEELVSALFRAVWALPPWEAEQLKALLDISEFSPGLQTLIKAQTISALLLGLLKFYDPSKFETLISFYNDFDDERIAARALMAITLVLSRWGKSAIASKEIDQRLEMLQDSILTYTRIRSIIMTLIRTRDTDRVSREVNEAFSTTMKEITPEMLEKMQREGMMVDDSETGMNPEWEKLMKNKEIEEKMQAINDMQLEGMDVMMQTFARLKSFPFFNSIANWFLPFSLSHSAVEPLFRSFSDEAFSAMAEATEMCSGDRFSFVMGILQMPEERRNMLASSVNASLEMVKEQIKDRENVRKRSVFDSEALSFARDLYRFAKIYPARKHFFDPFELSVDFLNLPVIGSILDDTDIIIPAADFYFKHGYYDLALPLYERVIAAGEGERHIFEKTGYCLQMLSDYSGALENYEKADLFSSDADKSSSWLEKRLAFCNKAMGNYIRAAEYYRRLLEADPEDTQVEFHLATVLLRSGSFKEAQEIISKIRYLYPDHKGAARVYSRLKGHEAFVKGDFKDALRLYTEARGSLEPSVFNKDLEKELRELYPEADAGLLQILLDTV